MDADDLARRAHELRLKNAKLDLIVAARRMDQCSRGNNILNIHAAKANLARARERMELAKADTLIKEHL